MLKVFLAIIVSGLLLLITAISLLVLPDGATATLVHPLPRSTAARIDTRFAGPKSPLVQAGADVDKVTTGSAGHPILKKESRP